MGFVRIEQRLTLMVNLGSVFVVRRGRLTEKVQDFRGGCAGRLEGGDDGETTREGPGREPDLEG